MEPLAVLAGTFITLIFTEASKEGGKILGKATTEQISQIKKFILSKLGRQEQISGDIQSEILEAEIVEVFKKEPETAEMVAFFIESVKSDPIAKQIILEYAKGRNLTLQGITQEGSLMSDQIVVSRAEMEGDISLSNIVQKQKNSD
jgi:hypothetical protein